MRVFIAKIIQLSSCRLVTKDLTASSEVAFVESPAILPILRQPPSSKR